MKTILKSCCARPVAVSLIVALVAMSSFAAPAEAMFIPAGPGEEAPAGQHETGVRAADLAKVEATLESKIVSQKLVDFGLSPSEARARVYALSDRQLHELASHTDSIQAGGDPVDLFVGLIIVAVLAVVLIYLVQGRIVVR